MSSEVVIRAWVVRAAIDSLLRCWLREEGVSMWLAKHGDKTLDEQLLLALSGMEQTAT